MEYLKNEQYYVNLYDLHTIESCIDDYWTLRKGMEKRRGELKDMTNEKFDRDLNKALNYILYVKKGERYRNKKKMIDELMTKDKVKQDKYDTTQEPQVILCSKYKNPMKVTSKHLEDYSNQPFRVLFFFECPQCKERKGVYDNGEERISKSPTCTKCGKEAKTTYKKKGKIITWTTKCLSCGFKEVDIDDFKKKDKEWKEKEQKDIELLEKYRKEFCLSEKDGHEYIELMEKLEVAKQVREEARLKYKSSVYQKVIHLKKLSIVGLEKLLSEYLEKEKYIKIVFNKPQIDQFVMVPFTVQDADSSRKDYESKNYLQKLIIDKLDNTNWRLLSNSIGYRLGYLSGQFKGYERQEDLIQLEQVKMKDKPKPSRVDEKLKMKYVGDPIVTLAKLEGEHEAIEELRKTRLKKEPKGFFLDASEGPYTCAICGETIPGNNIWWNLDGLRCSDCWRNIQEKIIPPLTWDHNNKIWIQDWQIHSDYNVHPATARKLRRLGELIGRDLKRKNGAIYCTVYLVNENKEFLKKYPKKPKIEVKFVSSKK